MKRFVFLAVLFALAVPVLAQEHYTEGPVWRVTYLDVKPGKMNDVLLDIRQNFAKVMATARAQGLILDFKVFLNTTTESPADWDVATAILYKNFAGIDGFAGRMDAITLAHYGSADNRSAAGAKRDDTRTVLMSRLAREITMK
jgi:hypothetical protein